MPEQLLAGQFGDRERRVLLAVATHREAEAVVRGILGTSWRGDLELDETDSWSLTPVGSRFDLVVTGVGKSQAAGGVARVADVGRHSAVLGVGVGGALPSTGPPELGIGDVVVATRCVFADEGLITPSGFVALEEMGFAAGGSGTCDPAFIDAIREAADASGVVATVSVCSGTDQAARDVAERTGAVVEAMEGAAVAAVAERLALPMGEIRAISNTTGDRESQIWDLDRALDSLSRTVSRL